MQKRRIKSWIHFIVAALALPFATLAIAQAHPGAPAAAVPSVAAVPNEKDVAQIQRGLIELLRLSPTLTTVVSHDPSLLSNQDYVARNNPQLAAFLAAHPEVARNPEFYLFSHLRAEGEPDEALQRAAWPEYAGPRRARSDVSDIVAPMAALAAFACFLAFVTWMVRALLENRRWTRIFRLQSEVHGRLIDKFGSNQELAAYMETDAAKRFLEAAPISVNIESGQRVPNVVARVLTPLQIGIVMVLLGTGLMLLRHAGENMETPMLVFGTVVLMPGIGFIISAAITWILAARLGLMPADPATQRRFDASNGSPSGFKDRQ